MTNLPIDCQFFSEDPHKGALTELEHLANFGADNLAIAVCYVYPAGLEFIRRLPFPTKTQIIVSDDDQTVRHLKSLPKDLRSVVRVHLGYSLPREQGQNGIAKMHSKVYYARNDDVCRLWVGSHNLTANALMSGNCEAAVILEGATYLQPFTKAWNHVQTLWNEAVPLEDFPIPENPPVFEEHDCLELDVLVSRELHGAFCALDHPSDLNPWQLDLVLCSNKHDPQLRAPCDVKINFFHSDLYSTNAEPFRVADGQLTGVNFTNLSKAVKGGMMAEWPAPREFSICLTNDRLRLKKVMSPESDTVTQAAITLTRFADSCIINVSSRARVNTFRHTGDARYIRVDGSTRYFTKASVDGDSADLVCLVPNIGIETQVTGFDENLSENEIRTIKRLLMPLGAKLAGLRSKRHHEKIEMHHSAEIAQPIESSPIRRTKYRVRKG